MPHSSSPARHRLCLEGVLPISWVRKQLGESKVSTRVWQGVRDSDSGLGAPRTEQPSYALSESERVSPNPSAARIVLLIGHHLFARAFTCTAVNLDNSPGRRWHLPEPGAGDRGPSHPPFPTGNSGLWTAERPSPPQVNRAVLHLLLLPVWMNATSAGSSRKLGAASYDLSIHLHIPEIRVGSGGGVTGTPAGLLHSNQCPPAQALLEGNGCSSFRKHRPVGRCPCVRAIPLQQGRGGPWGELSSTPAQPFTEKDGFGLGGRAFPRPSSYPLPLSFLSSPFFFFPASPLPPSHLLSEAANTRPLCK